MIVRAKYVGPYPEVTCNGTTASRGEVVRLRIPDHQSLGGDWLEVKDDDAPAAPSAVEADAANDAGASRKKGA